MSRKGLRVIDLSVPIDMDSKETSLPKIIYSDHEQGVIGAAAAFNVEPEDFPERKAWASETVTLSTHTGTHVDAPWHYWPTSGGAPARTIDQLPIEWFYGDGVVLDFTDKPAGYAISSKDIQEKLKEINYQLKPYDIVMIRADTDKKLYDEDYAVSHIGASAEATHWLIEQGIKVMGTDGWGWDIPFKFQSADYKQNPRPGVLWAAHFVGKEKEYCQIEKLANLDQLPAPYGFKVAVFPIKIKGGSGGWARPVAIFNG